jgi:ABC-type sugar transport system substrate-binding protein
MHGDCRGADKIAAAQALDLGFWVEAYPAEWDKHGKKAGILRNLQMLKQNPDVVLAFRRNGSRGTTHMIEAAKAKGIPVVIHEHSW